MKKIGQTNQGFKVKKKMKVNQIKKIQAKKSKIPYTHFHVYVTHVAKGMIKK